MAFDTITIISTGMATVNDQQYEYKEFSTEDKHLRILSVRYPDERIYDTYYDPYKEEFKHALKRILPPLSSSQ